MSEQKTTVAAPTALPSWQYLHGEPQVKARFKTTPEDFQVTEDFTPSDDEQGEHQWLWIEKRGANTRYVADQLAAFAGIAERDVGFAGMKDRHAVTRQWFSIQLPGQELLDWQQLDQTEFKVLRVVRQPRKLKTGAHKGNQFRIRLRDVSDIAALQARFAELMQHGVPNYFGEQRFGRGGRNIHEALRWFSAGRKRRVSRHKQGLLLSAARSFLFNEVLSARLEQHQQLPLSGDVMQLAGTRSYFLCEHLDAEIEQRLASGDITPTAPLWGRGALPTGAAVEVLEKQITAKHPELRAGLEQNGLKQDRRALWLRLQQAELSMAEDAEKDCWLSFYLPTGCFATSVIRELITIVDNDHDEDTIE